MKDVILIFPPDFREINEPCVTLPPLKAYLQSKGKEVYQIDANAEFYNYITDRQGFGYLYDKAKRRFIELDNKHTLNPIEQLVYSDLAWVNYTAKEDLIKLIIQAKFGLKDNNDFFDFKKYSSNKKIINTLMKIPSALLRQCDMNLHNDSIEKLERIFKEENPQTPYDEYINNVLIPEVKIHDPKLVNISLVSIGQLIPAMIISKRLKKRNIHITISNYYPTLMRDQIIKLDKFFNYFDSAIIYEEELPTLQLINALINNESLEGVSNFIYREKGRTITTRVIEPIPMNEIPTPDFDDLHFANYFTPEISLPILTSRGCYWGECKFCGLHKGAVTYSQKDPLQVVNDLKILKEKYKTDVFLFFDTVMNPKSMLEMVDGIINADLKIYWTSVTRFDEKIAYGAEKIFRSGCRMLEFEYESCKEITHKKMNTGIDLDLAKRCLKSTSDAGVINTICLLYGLPGETTEDFEITNNFIINNKDIIHSIITFTYNLVKDSKLWSEKELYEIKVDNENRFSIFFKDYLSPLIEKNTVQEEGIFDLFEKTIKEYPSFFVSYFPIIYYSKHYDMTNPRELVNIANKKISFGKNSVPSLQNTKTIKLNYNVQSIKNQFIYSQSGDLPIKSLPYIHKRSGDYLFNSYSNTFVPLDNKFQTIMDYIDGVCTVEDIVKKYSKDSGLSYKQAFLKIYPILVGYSNII